MKRIYPCIRGFLKISDSYYRSWNKVIRRSRALPLSLRLVRGLFVYGCLKDNPEFSLVVLLGFVMLLRPGEILAQRSSLFTYVNEELMVVKVWGKQSARTGEWETVLLKDPLLIKVICNLKKKGKDFLFNKSSNFSTNCIKRRLFILALSIQNRLRMVFGVEGPRGTLACTVFTIKRRSMGGGCSLAPPDCI